VTCDCFVTHCQALVGWLQKAKLMETLITVFLKLKLEANITCSYIALFLALDYESI